jgi:hypothetical protein
MSLEVLTAVLLKIKIFGGVTSSAFIFRIQQYVMNIE